MQMMYTDTAKRIKGVFTWIRIELRSGSNLFHFCWKHRGLEYICLHESWTHSGLSSFHFSLRIEHSIRNEMSIRIHVNFGQDFILEWNSEIDVHYSRQEDFFCKIKSFIHVLEWIRAKIAETITGSVHKGCVSGYIFHTFSTKFLNFTTFKTYFREFRVFWQI